MAVGPASSLATNCRASQVLAATAHWLRAEPRIDAEQVTAHVPMTPMQAHASPFFKAITARQCTRGDYDGKPLTVEELHLLELAGTSSGVRMLLLTERPAMERVLDHVVQGNIAQMADAAFVKELKSWIRFNGADAVLTRDGLFSLASGNPVIPTWCALAVGQPCRARCVGRCKRCWWRLRRLASGW
jgi:hypothetical protein